MLSVGRSASASRRYDYCSEICDFEISRELLRMRRQRAIRRLDRWNGVVRYLPINTPAMRMAAELWARARMGGYPTARSESLDADVILAAHALQAKIDFELDVIVATTNVEHLARFVPACRWQDIQPEE